MGYAIKLNGAYAPNLGMGTVSFYQDRANAIAEAYFAVATTATAQEKNALKSLLLNLMLNGVYDKFKYMLPMLGSTVADKLVDVVTPTDSWLYDAYSAANVLGNFSVDSNNMLAATPTSSGAFNKQFGTFGATPYSIVGGYYVPNMQGGATSFIKSGCEFNTAYDVVSRVHPYIKINSQMVPASSFVASERNITAIASYDGETATVYNNGTVIGTATIQTTLAALSFVRIMSFSNAQYNFLAFTDKLTADESTTVTQLLQAFNGTLGRIIQ